MRNLLLYLTAVILFSACGPKPAGSESGKKDSFTFVFMTDIHLQPERHAVAGFQKAIDSVNKLKPDFMITGGDNVSDALEQNWQRADSLYRLFNLMKKKFNMPVYTTIGNHDVFGLYKESGVSPDHPEFGKKMYENRLGKRYYSFDHKNWHFIVLDDIGITKDRKYIGLIDADQLAWLGEDLSKTGKEKPVAAVMHIPLLSVEREVLSGLEEGLPASSLVTNAREVITMLEKYNVKFVLQGHTHFIEDIYYNCIHYISGGAVSGVVWNGSRHGLEEGFVLVNIDGEDFSWKYIDYGWQVPINQTE